MLLKSVEAIVLLLLSSVIYAGDPLFSRFGAGEAAMAYSCVASTECWSPFHNQASLAYNNTFAAGVSFESRFLMQDMSTRTIALVIPGRPAPLGIISSWYGNSQYSVISAGLGSAVILTDGLSLGVQADIITEHSAGRYKDLVHVTFETGVLARITPNLMFGAHVFNPLSGLNSLQSSLQSGITWTPDRSLRLAVEAVKSTDEPLSLHTGMAWIIPKAVTLRAGYSSAPSSFAFGIGFTTGRVTADTGFVYNTETGMTPSVSLLWRPGKR